MESIGFWILKSYTFLAPLSDPILGSEIMESIGICHYNPIQFLAPLSDPIFGAENGRKIMESVCF